MACPITYGGHNKRNGLVFEKHANYYPSITVDTSRLEMKNNNCSAEINRIMNLTGRRMGMLKTLMSSSEE